MLLNYGETKSFISSAVEKTSVNDELINEKNL